MTDPLSHRFAALAAQADRQRPPLRLGLPRRPPARPLSILLPLLVTGSAMVALAVLVVRGPPPLEPAPAPFSAETDRLFDPYAPDWPLAAATKD